MKTNAMRLLDEAKIDYRVVEYQISKEDFNGLKVSEILNMQASEVYKTLALRFKNDIYICVIPVNKEIDLKKCAKEIGVKNLEMLHVKDLLKYVGYERGSVTPIGVKKNKGIYFDKEVLNHETIEISGGMFKVGIIINSNKLLNYLKAEVKDIANEI